MRSNWDTAGELLIVVRGRLIRCQLASVTVKGMVIEKQDERWLHGEDYRKQLEMNPSYLWTEGNDSENRVHAMAVLWERTKNKDYSHQESWPYLPPLCICCACNDIVSALCVCMKRQRAMRNALCQVCLYKARLGKWSCNKQRSSNVCCRASDWSKLNCFQLSIFLFFMLLPNLVANWFHLKHISMSCHCCSPTGSHISGYAYIKSGYWNIQNKPFTCIIKQDYSV